MNEGSGEEPDATERELGTLELDRLIHERARLKVLTYLATAEKTEIGFTELRDKLGFTAGNLSVQLKTLEEAGYVTIEKRFINEKPFTGVSLTVAGGKALKRYVADLEVILASLKAASSEENPK